MHNIRLVISCDVVHNCFNIFEITKGKVNDTLLGNIDMLLWDKVTDGVFFRHNFNLNIKNEKNA
jgi:hypothetical protein